MGIESVGGTALVVDDELSDIELMRTSLESGGYTVVTAESYDMAVAEFERHSGEVDILIADVSLPGDNGVDLAKHLLRAKPDLKVLFVSGHVGAEVIRFYGLPATDRHFLKKPFRGEELVKRVREVFRLKVPSGWLEPVRRTRPLRTQNNG